MKIVEYYKKDKILLEHYKNIKKLLKLNITSNFWSCKFTANSTLIKPNQKAYQKSIKFDDIEIEKKKFTNIKALFWNTIQRLIK